MSYAFGGALAALAAACGAGAEPTTETRAIPLSAAGEVAPQTIRCGGTTTATVTVTGAHVQAPVPVDLVLMVDESSSIDPFTFGRVQGFLRDLTAAIHPVFANGGRVGVVRFADDAQLALPLSSDPEAVRNVLAGIVRRKGGTCLDCALRLAREELARAAGPRRRFVLLAHDGASTLNPQLEGPELEAMDALGVSRYVVGVGALLRPPQLERLASDPDASHLFYERPAGLAAVAGVLAPAFNAAASATQPRPEVLDARLAITMAPGFAAAGPTVTQGELLVSSDKLDWRIGELWDASATITVPLVYVAPVGGTVPAFSTIELRDDAGTTTSIASPLVAVIGCDPKPALLVVNEAGNLPAGDVVLRDRLVGLGFAVEVRPAADTRAEHANGKTVVVVSESTRSIELGSTFRDSPVPVVSLEPAIFDDLGMTGPTWMQDFGDASGVTEVDVVGVGHPAAAGLAGRTTVLRTPEKIVWGSPTRDATAIATVVGNPSQLATFVYPSGATMVGLRAPARRVGHFPGANAPTAWTEQGARLFDALVAWAAGGQTNALMVVAPGPLEPGDRALRSRLETGGYDVVLRDDAAVTPADASGTQLVVVSESALSSRVDPQLRDLPVGMLVFEPAFFDELGMTGGRWDLDQGIAPAAAELDVIGGPHPLAAGRTGRVQVLAAAGKTTWGAPGPGAVRIATLPGQPDRAGIFAYEAGAAMPTRPAPARRVGFFTALGAAALLTSDGNALLDAAIAYAGATISR